VALLRTEAAEDGKREVSVDERLRECIRYLKQGGGDREKIRSLVIMRPTASSPKQKDIEAVWSYTVNPGHNRRTWGS